MQERAAFPAKKLYTAYLGNTHAHSTFSDDATGASNGLPSAHYVKAKDEGYDFYCIADHICVGDPGRHDGPGGARALYMKMASDATTETFVGILAMEYTNNDVLKVADGWGHINVFNSDSWFYVFDDYDHYDNWMNKNITTKPPHTLKELYQWMSTTGNARCSASFNHPSRTQYNSFSVYDAGAIDHITMFEVYNTNTSYWASYKTALDHGWKLAPITGIDNHALGAISNSTIRTGVMAESLTRDNIYDAFFNRRAYASMYKKLRVLCWGNHMPMGSTLAKPDVLYIDVEIDDRQTSDPDHKITKIEVIGSSSSDAVIASKVFDTPDFGVSHSFRLASPNLKYYMLKIYSVGMGSTPCAYTAPIWTGR
ncbi:hypothetical protein FACS1894159_09410 [Bacteroidia bacterium]|nr:hypothetical protein FACS1894159_09410 [Bacteroidia bacterium]